MFPQEITDLRVAQGLTMSQLAQILDIDVNLLVDWEQGERFPTKKHVELMLSLSSAS